MERWKLGLGLAAGLGLGALAGACLLEPNVRVNCGDGYIDREAGEECEPALVDSYAQACREVPGRSQGEASCDPEACVILATAADCARCGDGIVDPGEDCDGAAFAQVEVCAAGFGDVRCHDDCTVDFSGCPSCGNGEPDDDEECDYSGAGPGGLVTGVSCTELASPYPGRPYVSGSATICRDDCTYNRIGCGYCGNGAIDTTTPVDIRDGQVQTVAEPEVCDAGAFPSDLRPHVGGFLVDFCEAEAEITGLTLRPNVRCNDECNGFVLPTTEPPCCVPRGAGCPGADADYGCCDATGDGVSCVEVWPGSGENVCGPGILPPLLPE